MITVSGPRVGRVGAAVVGWLVVFAVMVMPASAELVSYSYTGASQFWRVPAGVTSASFVLVGAPGGLGAGASVAPHAMGGRGAVVVATLAVTPNTTLQITVGGAGGSGGGPGGFNGGGGVANGNPFAVAGAGGGATDVRSGAYSLANRLLVAGGGGGGGGNGSGPGALGTGGVSGGSGGWAGVAGSSGVNAAGSNGGGAGGAGNVSSGGATGAPGTGAPAGSAGQSGTLAQGAAGTSTPFAGGYGGGGGGGLFGGGSGGSGGSSPVDFLDPTVRIGSGGGGGGGGSSLAPAGATVAANTAGLPAGVAIAYTPRPAPPPGLLCGKPVVLTDITLRGDRVRLAGVARSDYAGQKVTILAGGRPVARAVIAPDGTFQTGAKRTARSPRLRYQARVAGRLSPAVRPTRRLIIDSHRPTADGVLVRGHLLGRLRARRSIAVRRILGCSTRTAQSVAQLRTNARGRFSVTLPTPTPSQRIVVYRLQTTVGGKTYTLPLLIRAPIG